MERGVRKFYPEDVSRQFSGYISSVLELEVLMAVDRVICIVLLERRSQKLAFSRCIFATLFTGVASKSVVERVLLPLHLKR
jgi:hypothetical protein